MKIKQSIQLKGETYENQSANHLAERFHFICCQDFCPDRKEKSSRTSFEVPTKCQEITPDITEKLSNLTERFHSNKKFQTTNRSFFEQERSKLLTVIAQRDKCLTINLRCSST